MRRGDFTITAVFLAAITLPGVGLLCGLDPQSISTSERRELAKPPVWSSQSTVIGWLGEFERYFSDHFAFRNRWIDWHAALLWYGLRTSASETVIAGRSDWMFYADDGGLEDYVEERPFGAQELDAWRRMLERSRDWLAARGIEFLFVIAPDKQTIYPEKMPAALRRLRYEYRADQLLAYMKGRSTVPIVDLRPVLFAARGGEPLYHRHDSHWNDRGALVAENAIAAALGRRFPGIHLLPRGAFVERPGVPSGDRTSLLGLEDREKATMAGLVPIRGWSWKTVEPNVPDPYGEDPRMVTEIPGSELPRALVFRDSFASRLIPYLSEHFSRAVYLWQKGFDPGAVERENPDVVIEEMVGRHLVTDVPYPDSLPEPVRVARAMRR